MGVRVRRVCRRRRICQCLCRWCSSRITGPPWCPNIVLTRFGAAFVLFVTSFCFRGYFFCPPDPTAQRQRLHFSNYKHTNTSTIHLPLRSFSRQSMAQRRRFVWAVASCLGASILLPCHLAKPTLTLHQAPFIYPFGRSRANPKAQPKSSTTDPSPTRFKGLRLLKDTTKKPDK